MYLELGKSSTSYVRVLSGMIRSHGFSRGCEDNILYNIAGFGTGIRLNERIIDWTTEPDTLEDDGNTIDQNDIDFRADTILDDVLDRASRYPSDVTDSTVEGSGGFEYIDSSTTKSDSDIHDFMIPTNRFEEISDIANLIEGFTLGRVYVDTRDKVMLVPILTPQTAYGFLITTTPDYTNDNADNTMYIMADYEWHDHISKDMGYSSKLYGILPADTKPESDHFDSSTYYENKTVEIAQLIRPPTNQGWEIWAAVSFEGVNNTNATGAIRSRWRLCRDQNGTVESGANSIVKNNYVDHMEGYDSGAGGIQTIPVMTSKAVDTSENLNYWLILSSVNSTATEFVRWYHDNSTTRGFSATAPAGTSSDSSGGTGWTLTKRGPRMLWLGIRAKSEPFTIIDQKAVNARIEIDSNIPAFPPQIKQRISAEKYLVMKAATTALPKRVYNFPALTIPNKPVLPGDIAMIVDSDLNLSTTGNPVSSGQITDVSYQWGIKGGGISRESRGPSSIALNIIGYSNTY